jgi:hypothetical protein
MELTIDIPEKVVERAAALGLPVSTLVSQALEKIAESPVSGQTGGIVDLIAMPEGSDIDFDPPKLAGPLYRPADLT